MDEFVPKWSKMSLKVTWVLTSLLARVNFAQPCNWCTTRISFA